MKEKTKMSAEEYLREFHPEKTKALEKLLLRGEVAKLMEEYASLKQSDWISVEDELPTIEKNGMKILFLIVFAGGTSFAKYMGGKWFMNTGDGDEELSEEECKLITHWQPLPEPPNNKQG